LRWRSCWLAQRPRCGNLAALCRTVLEFGLGSNAVAMLCYEHESRQFSCLATRSSYHTRRLSAFGCAIPGLSSGRRPTSRARFAVHDAKASRTACVVWHINPTPNVPSSVRRHLGIIKLKEVPEVPSEWLTVDDQRIASPLSAVKGWRKSGGRRLRRISAAPSRQSQIFNQHLPTGH
jgi:hypothetical protein